MRRRTPTPSAAIVTGIGMIAFALFYSYMGIFPNRTPGSPPSRAVLLREEPAKFRRVVILTLVVGGGILTWGLFQLRRR